MQIQEGVSARRWFLWTSLVFSHTTVYHKGNKKSRPSFAYGRGRLTQEGVMTVVLVGALLVYSELRRAAPVFVGEKTRNEI
jgi:hypothetical protein